MVQPWHLICFVVLLCFVLLFEPVSSAEHGHLDSPTFVFHKGKCHTLASVFVVLQIVVSETYGAFQDVSSTVNALIPGDITLGGLFPIHDKSNNPAMSCGLSINAERGIQVE